MNLPRKQKQTRGHTEQTCACLGGVGVGEAWIWSLGFANANYNITYKMDKQQGPII